MKKKFKKLVNKVKKTPPPDELAAGVPRITNDTVAEHREEVIGSAKKYIYPLQHSKHRIVIVSSMLFIAATVSFFAYCLIALYRLQTNSTFLYRVTEVIPFPVARVGGKFVAYENYLFELRHYVHYYETQQRTDFNEPNNEEQLKNFKNKALDKVINEVYIKQLAQENNIQVSNKEVDSQLVLLRNQNRLGSSEKVFEDVLKDYWNWTIDDFKRELKSELLIQKLLAQLDTDATSRATKILDQLNDGKKFEDVAKKYSDDQETKARGGEYGFPVDKSNRNLSASATEAIFKLKKGEYSKVINTGKALEIFKVIDKQGNKVRAAHIVVDFKGINVFIDELKEKQGYRSYISF